MQRKGVSGFVPHALRLPFVLILLPACNVFLPARCNTFVTEDQKVSLELHRTAAGVAAGQQRAATTGATSGFFGVDALIGFVKAQALAAIDADLTRYTADYAASVAYPDLSGAAPECTLQLQRTVCAGELAAVFDFEVKPSQVGDRLLLVKPTLVTVKKARAKVLGWNLISVPAWFMPKSDTLNIAVTVKINSFTVDSNNKPSSTESAAVFVFNDYPLDKPPDPKDLPNALGVLSIGQKGPNGEFFLFTVSVTEADPLHAQRKADPLKELLSKLVADLQA